MTSSETAGAPRAIVLMADRGQDPTECSTPWKRLKEAGFTVDIATEKGAVPEADQKLVEKSFFKSVLGPKAEWTRIYLEMVDSAEFKSPLAWSKEGFSLLPYDAVILPGGHDKPMKQFLESSSLHALIAEYWPLTQRNPSALQPSRVLGAICHGVLVLAFTKIDGRSVLADVETTTLPQWMEGLAQGVASFWGLGQYYRTYPGRWTHEDVLGAVTDPAQYKRGPLGLGSAFAHTDPKYHYVSARWPGDSDEFAKRIIEEVKACREEHANSKPST